SCAIGRVAYAQTSASFARTCRPASGWLPAAASSSSRCTAPRSIAGSSPQMPIDATAPAIASRTGSGREVLRVWGVIMGLSPVDLPVHRSDLAPFWRAETALGPARTGRPGRAPDDAGSGRGVDRSVVLAGGQVRRRRDLAHRL